MLVKEYKLSIMRWISSREPMNSLVTTVRNTVLCTWNLYTWILLRKKNLRVIFATHTHTHRLCEVLDVLINLIMVIISQCIHISNQYTLNIYNLTCQLHHNKIEREVTSFYSLTLQSLCPVKNSAVFSTGIESHFQPSTYRDNSL